MRFLCMCFSFCADLCMGIHLCAFNVILYLPLHVHSCMSTYIHLCTWPMHKYSCICICICICIHLGTILWMCAYAFMYLFKYVYSFPHVLIFIYLSALCVSTCGFIFICVWIWLIIYICVYQNCVFCKPQILASYVVFLHMYIFVCALINVLVPIYVRTYQFIYISEIHDHI